MRLAERVKEIKPSATIELSAAVREMKQQGIPIISLNIGEPDFAPPKEAEEGVIQALTEQISKYGPVPGMMNLRGLICNKLEKDNNLIYAPDQICVSNGTKQAIINSLLAICGPEDEVLVPTPSWVSYDAMIRLCGAKPIEIPCFMEDGFLPRIGNLKKAITSNTRAIIINTPNNPTGAVYSKDLLEGIVKLACDNDFWIISDEIYEKIIYNDNKHISIASISDDAYNHTITTNGFSKAYAMPGWRVGYSAAPKNLSKAISSVQGHMTSAVSSISQMGAYTALLNADEAVRTMTQEYSKRVTLVDKMLSLIPKIRYIMPQGTFYFFVDVTQYFGTKYNETTINNANDLALFFLNVGHVAVVSGEAFSYPGFIRISVSNSKNNLIVGLKAISETLKLLS